MKNLFFGLIAVAAAVGGAWVLVTSGSSDVADPGTAETTVAKPPVGEPEEEPRPRASEKGPWPKAVADESEFKFGSMQVGSEKEHEFVIRNEGEADLHLKAGQPTCKCTAFELADKVVPPGEQTTLLVRWVGKFKDDNFQHGGPVFTDDPEHTELRFNVGGIVDAAFELYPEDVWSIGGVSGTAGASIEAMILSRVYDEFSVTEIKSDSPYIQTAIRDASPAVLQGVRGKKGYVIEVHATPDMPPGHLETRVHISTDKDDSPMSVTVRASKSGPVRLLPLPGVAFSENTGGLRLGQFPASQGRKAELMVLADQEGMDGPLELTSIESNPSFVRVEMTPMGAAAEGKGRYKLSVEIPPGIPRGSRDTQNPGTIDMQTNHPSGQVLNLRFVYKAF